MIYFITIIINNRIVNIKNKLNKLTSKSISSDKLKQLKNKINDMSRTNNSSTSLLESAQKTASRIGNHVGTLMETTQKITNHPIVSKVYSSIVAVSIIALCVVIYFFMDKVNKKLEVVLKNLLAALVLMSVSNFLVPMVLGTNNVLGQTVSVAFIAASTFMFIMFFRTALTYYNSQIMGSPWLIKGTHSGKNSMVIPQDPNNPESVMIHRSIDEDGGLEFSYDFWIIIDNFSYRTEDMKHVFHKGDGKAKVNMCPGVWLLPNVNTMRIYINTLENKDEYVDIENFPLDKWVHVALVVKQKLINVYINGFLKHSTRIDSIPRQNFGNVWVNLFGGFDGFLSKLRYHNRSIEPSEVMSAVNAGPSSESCGLSGEKPPYLADTWWLN